MIIKHVHTFKRHPLDKAKYFCKDPHCTYEIERLLAIGKTGICPKCGNEFVLTFKLAHTRIREPVCLNCSPTIAGREYREKQSVLAELFGEQQENKSL